jgi:Ca2+-binding RTX toxin-like protein
MCHGQRATIVGSDDGETIVGTPHADVIVGGGGPDVIHGRGGDDWICGGNGNDLIDGGRGDDHEYGQGRYDQLLYSRGDDVVDGGARAGSLLYEKAPHGVHLDLRGGTADIGREHDTIRRIDYVKLTPYRDVFVGTDGPETVYAGAGNDVIKGRGGDDYLIASRGDDVVEGGAGDDTIHGNSGTDRLIDLHGSNLVSDGATSPSTESGVIRTGPGVDRIFLGFYGSLRVHTGGGRDRVYADRRLSATSIWTGAGNDILRLSGEGYSAHVVAFLQDGDDVLECGDSCDGATVHGGLGANRVEASRATTDLTVVLGPDGSIASGATGAKGATRITNFVSVRTGSGADVVTGSDAANSIATGGGDDTVSALGGDDVINAGSGEDAADGGAGDDECYEVESPTHCETVG